MLCPYDNYEIDDARDRFDTTRVQSWLATTYWWGDTATSETVHRAFANSALIVGVYQPATQVACCRIVSDKTRFAWLADVYVDPPHRHRGLARAMVRFVLAHSDLQTITRFLLATRDAHDL